MTPIPLLALETLGLILGGLLILSLVGAGLTLLMLPDDRWALLLAPAVGVGVMTLGFQYLVYLAAPHIVAVVMFTAGGVLTVVVLLRRRMPRPFFDEIGWAVLLTFGFAFGLMCIVIPHGFFTLGSFPSDNIFIYTQAGQYLKDHSSPLLTGYGNLVNLGSFVVAVTGWSVPNSKGVFDAAASVLTGLPVYAVFDFVNAIAIAASLGPIWYFVRSALGMSRTIAALSALFMATNQMLFWVEGNGFQHESVATPIFTAGLAVAAVAFRTRSAKAGVFAGLLTGSLLGLYFPIAVLLIALAGACFAVHLVVDSERRLDLWRPAVGAVVACLVAGTAAFFALSRHGLVLWLAQFKGERVTGGVGSYPAPFYILGQLSFAHRWEPMAMPYTLVDKALVPVLLLVSVLVIFLMFVGNWQQLLAHRAPEAAILTAGMLGVLYEIAIADFAYGFVKAVTYIEPFISVSIAVGTVAAMRWLVRRSPERWGRPAAAALVVVLLGTSVLNSAEMVKGFVDLGPTLTRESLRNAKLADDIPVGSNVYVFAPAILYRDLVKAATVAYFLPDRSVRIYVGELRIGTFLDQDQEAPPCAFDYVVSEQAPPGDFTLVDPDAGNGFSVYRHNGPPCPAGG